MKIKKTTGETPVISVEQLTHRYGKRTIYEDLNFSVSPGKIYALLGKNGVGKTTLIKILMGFLRPVSGQCRIFGEDSHNLSPHIRSKIGLLFEEHLAYGFMSIRQIERFYASFYSTWNSDIYYRLVEKLDLPQNHLIKNMSCGQRSQVVLGLIMAQQPELLLLDDYSIGLDAGYRRLFLDDMREYLNSRKRTIFLTSHVIQDMEGLVDEVIFLERGGALKITSLDDFKAGFHCYRIRDKASNAKLKGLAANLAQHGEALIKNIEIHSDYTDIFSFSPKPQVDEFLQEQRIDFSTTQEIPMSLEDAFIGYTGRY